MSIILKAMIQISVMIKEEDVMEKNKRVIYEVIWNTVDEWDDFGYPTSEGPIEKVMIDDEEYYGEFYTTNILKAADRYDFISDMILDCSADEYGESVMLIKTEIYLGDDEWEILENKEILDFDDIAKFKITSSYMIAMQYQTPTNCDSHGDYYGEILRVESQYFNMKAICKKAGINYSTYKGFKNNNQYFSRVKTLTLLKCMHDIGINCFNDSMQHLLEIDSLSHKGVEDNLYDLRMKKLREQSNKKQGK